MPLVLVVERADDLRVIVVASKKGGCALNNGLLEVGAQAMTKDQSRSVLIANASFFFTLESERTTECLEVRPNASPFLYFSFPSVALGEKRKWARTARAVWGQGVGK